MIDPVESALQLAGKPHVGPINSHVAGRTDHIKMSVPPESFVVPADVVSGLGEGNTANGMKVLSKLFGMEAPAPRAAGGSVPIAAAGGEFVIPPEKVSEIGSGDMKRGHQILDHFVRHARADTIKTLRGLPGPHK